MMNCNPCPRLHAELPEFERAIETALRRDIAPDGIALPKRHRLETPNCPPLPRFVEACGNDWDWNKEEIVHIEDCPYCQMTINFLKRERQSEGT